MTQPTTVEVWFLDGPADGAIRSVECGVDGSPPELLMFGGGRVFVGTSDVAAPAACAAYALEEPVLAGELLWQYRHVGTLSP